MASSSNVDDMELSEDANFLEEVNFFVEFYMAYAWSFSDGTIELPEIRGGNKTTFYPEVLSRILTTQFFLRWYIKKFMEFTFKKHTFKNEIKLLWQTWITNRSKVNEKFIDGVAIIIEASLYCSKYKGYKLTLAEGQELFTEWFQDLKSEFIENGGWDEFYKPDDNYKRLTVTRIQFKYHFRRHENPPYVNDYVIKRIKGSSVRFPCPPKYSRSDMTRKLYIFVRLHQEMEPFRIVDDFDENSQTIIHAYFPLDRQEAIKNFSKYGLEDYDTFNEENVAEIEMDTSVKNFVSNVLHLAHDDDAEVVLISEKYKNSLAEILSKRYNQSPGSYIGVSGMPCDNTCYSNDFFFIRRLLPPSDKKVNWIIAAHYQVVYYMYTEPITTDPEMAEKRISQSEHDEPEETGIRVEL